MAKKQTGKKKTGKKKGDTPAAATVQVMRFDRQCHNAKGVVFGRGQEIRLPVGENVTTGLTEGEDFQVVDRAVARAPKRR